MIGYDVGARIDADTSDGIAWLANTRQPGLPGVIENTKTYDRMFSAFDAQPIGDGADSSAMAIEASDVAERMFGNSGAYASSGVAPTVAEQWPSYVLDRPDDVGQAGRYGYTQSSSAARLRDGVGSTADADHGEMFDAGLAVSPVKQAQSGWMDAGTQAELGMNFPQHGLSDDEWGQFGSGVSDASGYLATESRAASGSHTEPDYAQPLMGLASVLGSNGRSGNDAASSGEYAGHFAEFYAPGTGKSYAPSLELEERARPFEGTSLLNYGFDLGLSESTLGKGGPSRTGLWDAFIGNEMLGGRGLGSDGPTGVEPNAMELPVYPEPGSHAFGRQLPGVEAASDISEQWDLLKKAERVLPKSRDMRNENASDVAMDWRNGAAGSPSNALSGMISSGVDDHRDEDELAEQSGKKAPVHDRAGPTGHRNDPIYMVSMSSMTGTLMPLVPTPGTSTRSPPIPGQRNLA